MAYAQLHDYERASAEHADWLAAKFAELPEHHVILSPSTWAEAKRYLPASVAAQPGPYRFKVAPYLKEIVDCLSVDSPIREVIFMKGAQVGATTGVLENAIGYCIDHVRTAPCMMVTADAELAKLRMDSYITPMLQHSRLTHLIASHDLTNSRKTGKTDKQIQWAGGGFLIPFGAQNATKLRSTSIQWLLRDEIDAWPDVVGKDGDPLALVFTRTATFEQSRKVLDISTPLLKGSSKIERRFRLGDQRYYFVRCLKCGYPQRLRWRHHEEGGIISGIVWETQDDQLVPESVRYLCESCHHPHFNEDKARFFDPAHGAEWKPTVTPSAPWIRSYHLSALYSPPGMQSWAACVFEYLSAWNVETGQPRSNALYQSFENNVLGITHEVRGEQVVFESVSAHRRSWYRYGEIPNKVCEQHCGGPVLLVTSAVDVHAHSLKVGILGWCRDRRPLLLDYHVIEGETEHLGHGAWLELEKIISEREYVADDDRRYNLTLMFIDSGYRTDTVYRFCAQYEGGVFPIKGREVSPKNVRDRWVSEFETPDGQRAYGITVDYYKERWSGALKLVWDGLEMQPEGMFNAPLDASDAQLKELTAERKVQRINIRTGERVGWEWKRPAGAANELWDLLVYNDAALDLLAWHYCKEELELEQTHWPTFWEAMTRAVKG